MREIIFRGKRVDNDEWVYGFYFERVRNYAGLKTVKHCYIKYETWDEGFITFEVKPETVGQFTGLTDKNGNKIFEGDIVAIDEYSTFSSTGKGFVNFYDGGYTSFYGQDLLGRDCYDPLCSVCKERYIIGNIYDNKELLEND